MKILMLNSSNRTNGNTAKALKVLLKSLELPETDVEYIDLGKQRIEICRGCRLCFDKGESACPIKDDLLTIYEKVMQANLIILSSPIYVEDINGIMKNWIDRMAFNCHRPILFTTKAFILLTSGSGASWHAARTMERASQTWGMRIIGKRKIVLGAGASTEEVIQKYGILASRDAKTIKAELEREREPSLLQLLTFHIQQWFYRNSIDPESYDHQFWKSKGWLENGRSYYSNDKISRVKSIVSKVLGKIILVFILK